MEREQERASEARRALNDLLCEVESMSASLEAEKARAGSLSAALSTTREMVKTVKIQVRAGWSSCGPTTIHCSKNTTSPDKGAAMGRG